MFSQPLLDTRGEAAPTFADARGLGHLHDASAPLAFLEHWTEPDKALFYSFVADQEALHQHCSLPDLNDKIVRQSRHTTRHTRDELRVTDGKLSVAAMLHATLLALRKCIPIATLKAQAEHEKPSEGAKVLLQVRRNARAFGNLSCARFYSDSYGAGQRHRLSCAKQGHARACDNGAEHVQRRARAEQAEEQRHSGYP